MYTMSCTMCSNHSERPKRARKKKSIKLRRVFVLSMRLSFIPFPPHHFIVLVCGYCRLSYVSPFQSCRKLIQSIPLLYAVQNQWLKYNSHETVYTPKAFEKQTTTTTTTDKIKPNDLK